MQSLLADPATAKLSLGKLRHARQAARACRRAGATACAASRRDLAVGVKGGKATIVQDELQNTYQLAKTTRPAGPRKRHRREHRGRHARTCPADTPGTIEDDGHRHGHAVRPRVGDARGHARGRALHGHLPAALRRAARSPAPPPCPSRSRAARSTSAAPRRFTGGTGAYRGISSGDARGARRQHAGRPERRDLVRRGLRDLLGHDGQRRRESCRSRRTPRSSRSCSRRRSRSAAAVRPRPVRLSARLSASSGSPSRSYSSYSGGVAPVGIEVDRVLPARVAHAADPVRLAGHVLERRSRLVVVVGEEHRVAHGVALAAEQRAEVVPVEALRDRRGRR